MIPQIIEPGQILLSTWGYDQTNASFFQVLKRTGKTVTVARLGTKNEWSGSSMVGTAMPCPAEEDPVTARRPLNEQSPLRRKIRANTEAVEFIKIETWGMYASPWDGKPVQVSCYA